jgi:hypothetical protein
MLGPWVPIALAFDEGVHGPRPFELSGEGRECFGKASRDGRFAPFDDHAAIAYGIMSRACRRSTDASRRNFSHSFVQIPDR